MLIHCNCFHYLVKQCFLSNYIDKYSWKIRFILCFTPFTPFVWKLNIVLADDQTILFVNQIGTLSRYVTLANITNCICMYDLTCSLEWVSSCGSHHHMARNHKSGNKTSSEHHCVVESMCLKSFKKLANIAM